MIEFSVLPEHLRDCIIKYANIRGISIDEAVRVFMERDSASN